MEGDECTATFQTSNNRRKPKNSAIGESFEYGKTRPLSTHHVNYLDSDKSEQFTGAEYEIGQEQQPQVQIPIESSSTLTQVPVEQNVEVQTRQRVESPGGSFASEPELFHEDVDLYPRLFQNAYPESANGSPNIVPPGRELSIISPTLDSETEDEVEADKIQRPIAIDVISNRSVASTEVVTTMSPQISSMRGPIEQHTESRTSPLQSLFAVPHNVEQNVQLQSLDLNITSSSRTHFPVDENVERQPQKSGRSRKSATTEAELTQGNVQSPSRKRGRSRKSATVESMHSNIYFDRNAELSQENLELQSPRRERPRTLTSVQSAIVCKSESDLEGCVSQPRRRGRPRKSVTTESFHGVGSQLSKENVELQSPTRGRPRKLTSVQSPVIRNFEPNLEDRDSQLRKRGRPRKSTATEIELTRVNVQSPSREHIRPRKSTTVRSRQSNLNLDRDEDEPQQSVDVSLSRSAAPTEYEFIEKEQLIQPRKLKWLRKSVAPSTVLETGRVKDGEIATTTLQSPRGRERRRKLAVIGLEAQAIVSSAKRGRPWKTIVARHGKVVGAGAQKASSVVVSVPRKRGRPPKVPRVCEVDAANILVDLTDDDSDSIPCKRPRMDKYVLTPCSDVASTSRGPPVS
ncbi:hypothetical protein ACTXT7_014370, partial [Hymenolepis weldensis]